MNTIRCPGCNEPLSDSAQSCAVCGKSVHLPEHKNTQANHSQGKRRETAVLVHAPQRADTLKLPLLDLMGNSGDTPSENSTNITPPTVSSQRTRSGAQTAPSKKERRRSGSHRPADDDWSVLDRPSTWHKEVAPSPNRSKATPLPPRPVRSRVPMLNAKRRLSWLYKLPPALFMWVSLLVLVAVVFSSISGIVATRSKGIDNATRDGELSLQVNPSSVFVGATVVLKGVHFSPHGRISLSRDNAIPIVDTSDASMTEADGQGNFSDTVAILPDWGPGQHMINAEDAIRHKVASFSILVTGNATSLRPAHLLVSANSVDLGSGDQFTNTVKTVTLANVGGGQISWQGSGTQPWLTLSPRSGTISSNQVAQVKVAIDRSKLNPGDYKAQIDFLSNAGKSTIAIKAEVTQLSPEHMAMLQVTPALLSFTATDGASPPVQMVTVNNAGLQQLRWQATTSASWLSASPQSASVDPLSSTSAAIGVNTSDLLPGTYSGVVTFSAQGDTSATVSSQSLQVTVTVVPQCSLLFSPGMLNFASEYQQSTPAPETITVGTYSNCNTPIAWQAISNANWLTISATSGTTPSTPVLGINAANLKPGFYTSSIIFSSAAGTQTFPVTFTLGQTTGPLVTTAPDGVVFNGNAGQAAPAPQQASIINNGSGGSMTWQAATTGGSWLTVSPSGGTLAPHQSATLSISVRNLSALTSGTYSGTVTITGQDGAGSQVPGSPQTIPVSLTVKSSCTVAATPAGLSFNRTAGLTGYISQSVAVLANTGCTDGLSWTALTATDSGGNWLTATSAGSAANNGKIAVSVTSAALSAGTYTGRVIITATDSVTKQVVGQRSVPVTLNVQSASLATCTLQAPSSGQESFTAQAGTSPATRSFTIAATGTCGGNITITPSVRFVSGSGWLTVAPGSGSVSAGGVATFTANVASASLPAGTYTAYISLAATNNAVALANSPQTVKVVLTVTKKPTAQKTPTPTPTPSPTPSSTSTKAAVTEPGASAETKSHSSKKKSSHKNSDK